MPPNTEVKDREAFGPIVSSRQPPANVDAERSALGCVILRPTCFDDVATSLTADDFFMPAHREIFDTMFTLDKKGHAIDVISVSDELKTRGILARLEGGAAYLVELANAVPTAENVGQYVRIVKEKATLRRLIGTCAEVQSCAFGDFGDFEEFLDQAESQIFEVAQQNRKESFSAVGDHMAEVLQNIEERAAESSDINGLPTGFTKFDQLTAGLQPGNLIVVAARPGVGKTSWVVNVCVNAALHHKMPVLIFSLEMSKFELMERMLAGEARINQGNIRRGLIEYADWKNKIYPAGTRLAGAPILIDDSASPSILDVRAKGRRFRGDLKLFPTPKLNANGRKPRQLGLIVIDYLQLCKGSSKKDDNREREIAEISRGLKALAKDLALPVIAVSQLNRGVEKRDDKRPVMSDLRESGAIEQDADMICFIHREEVFTPGPENAGKAELIVAKHRNGSVGSIPLTFTKEYTRFENAPDEHDERFE